MVNFIENKDNLKESVNCGEENRAESLAIKLELLSQFGRQITSSNVMPEDP
jgi:hypothetical protein